MAVPTDALEIDDMFDVEEEALRSGSELVDDPYPGFAALLSRAPVHEGPIGALMGLAADDATLFHPGRRHFSAFSFAAVSEGFTRPDDFNSELLKATGIFADAILAVDGARHRLLRDVIQDHFQPVSASSWWREKVVAGLVEELVEGFAGRRRVDLNSEFFARLLLRWMK